MPHLGQHLEKAPFNQGLGGVSPPEDGGLMGAVHHGCASLEGGPEGHATERLARSIVFHLIALGFQQVQEVLFTHQVQ